MEKKEKLSGLRRFFTFRSFSSKLLLAIVLNGVIVTVLMLTLFSKATTDLVEQMVGQKLRTDISYLEDIIDKDQGLPWNIKNGRLYKGDILIGDGTDASANLEPFYETETKSGTFVYTFMRCGDTGLSWVGDEKTGYQQGHYIRVAGTTKDPNGNSIIGTYIDKKVADVLDAKGEYEGQANVTGGIIYCYYKTLVDENGETVGVIVVGRSMKQILNTVDSVNKRIVNIMIAIMLISAILMFLSSRKWTKTVEKVEAYLRRLGNGEYPEEELVLNTKDEISLVADSINDMVKSLKEGQRMGSELSVATDIQSNLLPKIFPSSPQQNAYDIYATMHPAKEVGGDFYDFFMVDSDHIALVIADVSGKGVPAALFMVIAKTLIKDHSIIGTDAGEVFTKANKMLCEGNEAGLFVTAWLGIVELSTGKVRFANAGHNPPVLCQDGEFRFLKSRAGFVLAGMEGIKYKTQEFQLNKGDVLYLYTDGVTESTNIRNELYGDDRLLKLLNDHKTDTMKEICDIVNEDTTAFTGEAEQFDDVTMIAFKYYGADCSTKEIVVEALTDNIPQVTAFVDEILESMDCSMKAQVQIDVAIDEIASNVCFYAYRGHTGFLKVVVEKLSDDTVAIVFVDGGMPYNPLEKEAPDITLSAEDRAVGGLGIHIVRKTMDDVSYEYANSHNILKITKKIK